MRSENCSPKDRVPFVPAGSRVHSVPVLLCVLVCNSTLLAQDSKTASDTAQDPLPKYAVARMGSTRWRSDTPVHLARFVDGGKTLLTVDANSEMRWWDAATGKS